MVDTWCMVDTWFMVYGGHCDMCPVVTGFVVHLLQATMVAL